jgi:serine protease Do
MRRITLCKKKINWKSIMAVLALSIGLAAASALTSPAPVEAKSADIQPADIQMVPLSFTALAEMASPAVINIRTVKTIKGGGRPFRHFSRPPSGDDDPGQERFERFFGRRPQGDYKQRSLGSGFIIDTDGHIVTNNHVVEDADQIKVILKDGEEYDAKIIGRDPNTDLALIKIKSGKDFPVLRFGSSNNLKVGQWVVAIGSPFGLEHTVTAGIVSAKGRVIGSGPYDDFIQTDASINPGNSGGPLINMKGEVIGINTAIVNGASGIGFAIPVDLARGIIEQLKTRGSVTRGWLGVGIQDLDQEIADYYGVEGKKGSLVIKVFPGDPADEAGIKARDIIISVAGEEIESSRDLTSVIANIPVGETIKVKVLRKGREKTFKVTVAKRKETVAARDEAQKEDELGIQVTELTAEVARRIRTNETEGVIVSGVEPGSKGEESGLLMYDIIKEINHKEVKSVREYQTIIDKIKKGGEISFFINRPNRGFLVIKLTK